MELLLNEGASVNFRNEDGYTALLLASALPFQAVLEQEQALEQEQKQKQAQEQRQSETASKTPNNSSWQIENDKLQSSVPILNHATKTTVENETQQQQQQQQQADDGKFDGLSEENITEDLQAEKEFLVSNWNEIATLLLAHNADVNIGDSTGQTPLMMVIYFL